MEKGNERLLHISNYTLGSSFCRNKKRGGVVILVKPHIEFKPLSLLDYCTETSFECCGISVNDFVIICIYRTPSSDPNIFFEKLTLILERFIIDKNKKIVLAGDFNINMLKNDVNSSKLRDLIANFNLTVNITEPTRQSTCIDLFVSNIEDAVGRVHELGLSDHNTGQTLHFESQIIETKSTYYYVYKRDYHLENVNKFRQHLCSLSWNEMYAEQNFEKSFNSFYSMFCLLYELCFPINRIKVNKNRKVSWLSKGLRKSCIIKRNLRMKYYKDKTESSKKMFRKYASILKKCIASSQRRINERKMNNTKNKCKTAWEIVNDANGTNKICSKQINSIHFNDRHLFNPNDIASSFNKHSKKFKFNS